MRALETEESEGLVFISLCVLLCSPLKPAASVRPVSPRAILSWFPSLGPGDGGLASGPTLEPSFVCFP